MTHRVIIDTALATRVPDSRDAVVVLWLGSRRKNSHRDVSADPAAQTEEEWPGRLGLFIRNEEVASSIPVASTKFLNKNALVLNVSDQQISDYF